MFVHQMIEAVVIGALAAASVLYTFQTRAQYPAWLLRSFDHPWILLVLFLVALFLFPWSPRIAVMLIFLALALWMDAILFSKHPIGNNQQKPTLPKPLFPVSEPLPEVWPFDEKTSAARNNEARDPLAGPPVASPDLLTAPSYPVFYGSAMHPIGPAPF